MNLYKIFLYILLSVIMSSINTYGQSIIKSQKFEFEVKNNTNIELISSYSNIEFEFTDNHLAKIEAIMEIEGLSQNEAEAYFKTWNVKAIQEGNKLLIKSSSKNHDTKNLKKHGFYKGYFLDKNQQEIIDSEIKALKKKVAFKTKMKENQTMKEYSGKFDFDAYIEDGDDYLLKWQKENNEPIGKRWFNKTKQERIQMRNSVKEKKAEKEVKNKLEPKTLASPKMQLKDKSIKKALPIKQVLSLPNRTIVNKTLKIQIPRSANLNIVVRHGKVEFSDEVTNLKADLSYVLLKANKITGRNTFIKGSYANFDVNHWTGGSLDVNFSDYVLIKKVDNLNLISNASIVSIDKAEENIQATGNYRLLDITTSSNIKLLNIDIEDSKKVWIKLPDSTYNLEYEGSNSNLIHPDKFTLKKAHNNVNLEVIKSKPLNNKERNIKIKALSCVLQLYEKPWEELRIKSLDGF